MQNMHAAAVRQQHLGMNAEFCVLSTCFLRISIAIFEGLLRDLVVKNALAEDGSRPSVLQSPSPSSASADWLIGDGMRLPSSLK
jgi:hypothetical protein